MQNIETKIVKNILTITIDLSKDLGPSNSGKTIMIASTYGAKNITTEAILNMNLYKYPTKK